MDKQELYDKVEKAINKAFEATKHSVKVVSEKAGETAQYSKLLIEKATLEHKLSKKFAALGNQVYLKATRESKGVSLEDPEIAQLIEETKILNIELSQIEATIEEEKRKKK